VDGLFSLPYSYIQRGLLARLRDSRSCDSDCDNGSAESLLRFIADVLDYGVAIGK
jgi:hypothetical protein